MNAVFCYTVVKTGLYRVGKRGKSTTLLGNYLKKINTQDVSVVFLKFYGNKKINNEKVLRRTGLITVYFTLSRRRLRWLGHIVRMDDERIPKSMLYSELVDGTCKRGRRTLHFKDVCKRDLKSLNVITDKWEELANDHNKWRSYVSKSLQKREK